MMKIRINMPTFFNLKIVKYFAVVLVLLWIPTFVMLIFGGKSNEKSYKATNSGKEVIIEVNGKTSSMDVEEFIPCALIAQIDVNSEEDYISYEEMKEIYKEDFTQKYNQLMKAVSDTAGEMIY